VQEHERLPGMPVVPVGPAREAGETDPGGTRLLTARKGSAGGHLGLLFDLEDSERRYDTT
jgi:hypothetical protein